MVNFGKFIWYVLPAVLFFSKSAAVSKSYKLTKSFGEEPCKFVL